MGNQGREARIRRELSSGKFWRFPSPSPGWAYFQKCSKCTAIGRTLDPILTIPLPLGIGGIVTHWC